VEQQVQQQLRWTPQVVPVIPVTTAAPATSAAVTGVASSAAPSSQLSALSQEQITSIFAILNASQNK
jgi:hypothetical protein